MVLKAKNVVNAIRHLEALEDDVQETVKSGGRVKAQIDALPPPVPLSPGNFGRHCGSDVTRDPVGKVADTITGEGVLSAIDYIEKVTRRIRATLK
jgi:hypothetical protein